MLRVFILTLILCGPVNAEQMTRAQEDAMRRIWDLTSQANDLLAKGSISAAEEKHAEALALTEQAFPGEALMRATALHNLAATRANLGRLPEALETAREALRLRREGSAGGTAIASSERLLASLLQDLERLEEARAGFAEAVEATLADPQADRTMLIHDTAAQAVLFALLGRHDAAEALMRGLEDEVSRADPADAARIFASLGRIQSLGGRPDLAEAAYREALRRSDGIADDPRWSVKDRAAALNGLGAMLTGQGRAAEAEPLFREALEGAGADPLMTAVMLDGLADSLRAKGQLQGAYDSGRIALDLRIANLPPEHPLLAASFNNIGRTLMAAGEVQVAAGAFAKALTIAEAAGDTQRAGRAAGMLAVAEGMLGRPAFDRASHAETLLAASLPPGNPQLAQARFNAAWIGLSEGRAVEALPLARAAMADYATSAARIGVDATVAASGDAGFRRQVLALTAAAWEVDRVGLMDEAFQAAQWAMASSAARSTQRMAARAAAGEGELAALVRARQDLVNRWRETDRLWLASAETVAAPADLAAIEAEIGALDRRIRTGFPDYFALTSPRALSLAEVQTRLTSDETLLVIMPTQDETYAFAINAEGAAWNRATLTAPLLAHRIMGLRADLDPSGPARAAVPLDTTFSTFSARARPFDRTTAHAIYTDLLAPLAAHLRPRVLVVADGALTSLPLAVLVASPPQGDDDDPAALAATDWLATRHAFATLPDVAALSNLRDLPRTASAVAGFAGFGAPDFAGSDRPPSVNRAFDGPRARTEALRALAPLPGTRRELLGLAAQLGAQEGAVRLGSEATEAAVRGADLSGARILAFATHGLIAGDIDGLAEPALAFTPSMDPGPEDDGLLTASEVANLNLAADWVILSACNTASGDGTPGAEGLSGLASAFLYAGARGLLVSHWPVGDVAAERLTQEAVARLIADPAGGQAAALSGAMAALRADPAFAHPASWAPFVVVGDGR